MWTGCMNKNFVNGPRVPVPVTLSETFTPASAYIA